MRYGRLILLFIFLTGIINRLSAQRYFFTTYAVNDGLVHNAARDIFQDSGGFLWIGTWEGLSKYDGHKFINYSTVNGLSNGFVNDIFESKNGNIFIAFNEGSLYVISKDEIPQKVPLPHIVINKIKKLPGNKIIAATDHNGLHEFNEGKLVKPGQHYPYKNYYNITRFNDSLFVAQSDSSIQLLNYRYELFSEWKESSPVFAETGLLTDSKGRVWLGTSQGLKLLSPDQEKGMAFRFLSLPGSFNIPILKDQSIRDILEDDAGNMWIGTFYGLVKIGADGSHQLITEKDGLPANDVTCIFQDREKNIWAGGSRGVSKLVTKTKIVVHTVETGLLSNNTFLLLPFRNGNIAVGSDKGLQLYDRAKGLFSPIAKDKSYYSDNNKNSSLSLLIEKRLNSPFVVFSQQDSDRHFFSPSPYGSYFAFKDRQGNFFYPDPDGLHFSHDFINWRKVFFYYDIRTMLIDSKGSMWTGSKDSGLFRITYDYINDTPRLIRQDHFFSGKGIRSLYEDSKGYIWVGTRYDGIFRMNTGATGETGLLHFDQSTGLTSNRITSIGEDKNGCIWLNFYNGLDKLIPDKSTYRIFNFSRINNFFTNIPAMIFDKEHSLWVATTQGLVNISDGEMEKTLPLNSYITKAYFGDSIYRNNNNKKITLNYHHKQVQFEFSAPGFINEKQVLYSYRLLGSNNEDWSFPSNEHSVSYASLQPGSYSFEVRTQGWNGEWGTPAIFKFSILPPFWLTWWFLTATGVIVIAITWWLVRKRIKSIRHEAELKHRITETEMVALRAQMNPHFIFNCLNAIDNLIQTNQKEKATSYLSRFAKLVRNVLDSSKNNTVPFHKDYESLQLYLQMEQFRCNNKFDYQLHADEELLHGDFRVPPLIMQPFVENAIHHGLLNKESNDRKLIISASVEKDYIIYMITDNGIGREKAKELKSINRPEHQSYGMQITEERVRLYNQEDRSANDVTITDHYENNVPSGTSIAIRLKIS